MAESVASTSRLLQHLLKLGLVTEPDVRSATARQKQTGDDILEALLQATPIQEQELAGALASFYRVPQVNLTRVRVTKQALRRSNGEFCRQHQVLPFAVDHQTGELMVALANPAQLEAVDALRFGTGQNVRTYVAPRSQLREAIEFYYFTDHRSARPRTGDPRRSARPTTGSVSGRLPTRPRTDLRGSSGLHDSGGDLLPDPSGTFRRPTSQAVLGLEDPPSLRAHGPGTDELGEVSLPRDPSDELLGRPSSKRIERRPTGTPRQPASTQSGLGVLNPFVAEAGVDAAEDTANRITRLEDRIVRLEAALRQEMAVSQALAEILVENGLISAEQIKLRLARE